MGRGKMMPDREGWPPGAVERVECCNCGKLGYAQRQAPPDRAGQVFRGWLRKEVWADGEARETVFGFFLWCSGRCMWVWFEKRKESLKHQDSASNEWRREMERRRRKVGL